MSIGLRKRSISVLLIENDKIETISLLNLSNSRVLHLKRTQKASQNAQFSIFQDNISSLNSYSSDNYRESSPVHSEG